MQILNWNPDWTQALASMESLVWVCAALVLAAGVGLALCAAAMVLSAFRDAGGTTAESEFMGFGRPVRGAVVRGPAAARTVRWRGPVLARAAALAGAAVLAMIRLSR